jgi:excisionase family DNA binding protein
MTAAFEEREPRLALAPEALADALGLTKAEVLELLALATTPEAKLRAGRLAYSVEEVALLTGMSQELVHTLVRTGELRSVKAGRRRLISRRHLDAFLAGDSDAA